MWEKPLKLIRSRSELVGTAYFELQRGRVPREAWQLDSVYVGDSAFGYIQPFFYRHATDFDRWGTSVISAATVEAIANDLEIAARTCANATSPDDLVAAEVGLSSSGVQCDFDNFADDAAALASMMQELSVWLRQQLEVADGVCVIGM